MFIEPGTALSPKDKMINSTILCSQEAPHPEETNIQVNTTMPHMAHLFLEGKILDVCKRK